jgi:hypothetical protein
VRDLRGQGAAVGLQRRSMSDDKSDVTIKAPVGIRYHKTERLSIVSESVCAVPPQRKGADPEKNQGTRLCPHPRQTRSAARRRATRAIMTRTNSRGSCCQDLGGRTSLCPCHKKPARVSAPAGVPGSTARTHSTCV